MTTGRPRFDPRQPQQRGPAVRVNHRIRVPEVRVVGADGAMIGVLTTHEALQMAQQQGLDLVEVNPKAVPPVCKILDFGKYKYETARQAREAKRKQAVVDIKEIKLRPKTDDHDLDFKTRAARRFIESGNKVKFTVRFRGREITHPEKAQRHLDAVAVKLEDIANIEVRPLMEGRAMTLLIAPKPHIMQKVAHARAQREKERALAAREGRAVAPEFEEPEEQPDLEDDDDDDDDDEEDEKDEKEGAASLASAAISMPQTPRERGHAGTPRAKAAGRLPFRRPPLRRWSPTTHTRAVEASSGASGHDVARRGRDGWFTRGGWQRRPKALPLRIPRVRRSGRVGKKHVKSSVRSHLENCFLR
jgi:translation initiation factor IF-3